MSMSRYKYEIAICAVAKNEEEYIEEWVEHHLKIGIEKIYLYDNNDDAGKLEKVLKNYVNQGLVEIIDCSAMKPVQRWAYQHFVRTNRKLIRWGAFIDIDEFIELNEHTSIVPFLEMFTHAQLIVLSWLGFGANNEIWKSTDGVKSRFPTAATIEQIYAPFPLHVKSIVRLQKVKKFSSPHVPSFKVIKHRQAYNAAGEKVNVTSTKPFMFPTYKSAYIKHYFTKSYEEWLEKISRGLADDAVSMRKVDEFFLMNSEMRKLNLPKTLDELLALKK